MLLAATPHAAPAAAPRQDRDLDLGHIFRTYGPAYLEQFGKHLPKQHWKAIFAIQNCRTAALGGHTLKCDDCGHRQSAYNSCRNRHCPKCQALDQQQWLAARRRELLPIGYFHVGFTIPGQLRPLALRNQTVVYNILFRAASETLLQLGRQQRHLGAELGIIAVLHTWSQTLIDHPHLHCIVTGGGLSTDGQRWISAPSNYLLPYDVLHEVFQGKFLDFLQQAYDAGQLDLSGQLWPLRDRVAFKNLKSKCYSLDWVLYLDPPKDQVGHLVDYLARYTHRVAISNDRILKLEDDHVTFSYLDRQDGNKRKLMTLHAFEFIRRFLLHILPEGFVKIRHYGLLSNRTRQQNLQRCRELLDAPAPPPAPVQTCTTVAHLL